MLGNPALSIDKHQRAASQLGKRIHRLLYLLQESTDADCLCLPPAARLFVQLVDLFQFYMMFPIDDHTGDPVSDEGVTAAHYEKVQQVGDHAMYVRNACLLEPFLQFLQKHLSLVLMTLCPHSIQMPEINSIRLFACLHALCMWAASFLCVHG